MPRKPRVDPPPLESFEIEVNGQVVECEVRDESCRLIRRGSHKKDDYEDNLWKIMERVVEDYLTPKGRRSLAKEKDYLISADTFVIRACLWGFGSETGDDGALRKRYYKDVLKQVQIFENAIKNKMQV